ncbi:peptidoglycan-binding domain-containing protein [Paracoccus beibuensis]|uniref:peptidoglycan-binding domain-containing protein n=1 Tax=Paracoccus beibuensis TaxID=547602 RepID=UPI00223EFEF9|nr:peptidoglycan-binding protein [Paracoccus beibuensis]
MVKPNFLAAITVGIMSVHGHSAYAEPDLGEVVGTIARNVLEQQQAAQERALWEGVIENGSAAAYRQYLNTYPGGPNAQRARDQLAQLEARAAADSEGARAEAQLGLTQANRLDVQRELAARGFYRSGIDGDFGSGTRRAIRAWQTANDFDGTGYLTRRQLPVLLGRATAAPAPAAPTLEDPAISAAQAELNLGLTRTQRAQIQRDLDALGYDPKGVDGLFGSGTRDAVKAWQRNKGQRATGYVTAAQVKSLRADATARNSETTGRRAAAIDEDLLGLTRTELVKIQQQLIGLSYLNGQADGVFGSATRGAIGRWQGDNGLAETGYLTAEQVRVLQQQARI